MSEHPDTPGHETRDMSFKAVALFGAGLLTLLAVGAVILVVLFTLIARGEAKSNVLPSMVTPTLPPAPRLESAPGGLLQQLQATEDQQLNSYGWVDRQNNIVHIPITRAMDLFAQQNQPAQPQGEWF